MGFIDTLTTKGPIEDSRIDYFLDAVPQDCVLYLPLSRNRLRGAKFHSLDLYRHSCTVAGALWTPSGRSFDGVDDNVAIPHNSALNGQQHMSYYAQIKLASVTPNGHMIIGKEGPTIGTDFEWISYLYDADADNQYHLYFNVSSTGDGGSAATRMFVQSTGHAIIDTNWHHIAVVVDLTKATVATKVRMFVDGTELVTVLNVGSLLTSVYAGNASLRLGETERLSGLNWTLNGLMPCVALFMNRILTPQEIQRFRLATMWRYNS